MKTIYDSIVLAPTIEFSCHLKAELLLNGVNINAKTLDYVDYPYKENNYGYNNPNRTDDMSLLLRLPTELILPHEIIVSFRYKNNSDFEVVPFGGSANRLLLTRNSVPVAEVSLSPRPKFWSCATSDGVGMKQIGSVYGMSTLVFFVLNHCQFFSEGIQCGFCDLNPTFDLLKPVLKAKSIQQITETMRVALSEDFRFTNFIGGSILNHDREIDMYSKIISECRVGLGLSEIRGFVISMPPNDFDKIALLRDAGITGVKFNLEIAGPELFNRLCPGKARYGQAKIVDALRVASGIFGRGNVYTNFVFGLEPSDDALFDIAERLAEWGVGVVAHVFHQDDGSGIADYRVPSLERTIDLYRRLHLIDSAAGIDPWLDLKSLRGCLSWEFALGYIS
jgi:hypothetical protein